MEELGSNPARNNFYYSFGDKYKFQLYYFKLVHCDVVVTTRGSQAQGNRVPFRRREVHKLKVIGFHSGPGVHPISSPSRNPLFHRCTGGIASVPDYQSERVADVG